MDNVVVVAAAAEGVVVVDGTVNVGGMFRRGCIIG
jgi:hypothetical protein